MLLSLLLTLTLKRLVMKPLSSIKSGYSSGVMASVVCISPISNPNEDAIELSEPFPKEFSISGASFVSAV